VKIGANGIERVYELALNEEEKAQLAKSAEAVRELIGVLKEKAGL